MSPFRTARLCAALALATIAAPLGAQSNPAQAPGAQTISDIERRLNDLTDSLTQTQTALQQSLIEIKRLHAELEALRDEKSSTVTLATSSSSQPVTPPAIQAELQALREQQEVLEAEIKQHEQTKVESASKYNVRVTGLVLFNSYVTAGVVDDTELPSYALPRNPGTSHGSVGATMRQTFVGLSANGPSLGGARTSAYINMDFSGGYSGNSSGYSSSSGYVRLRDADLRLDWDNRSLDIGYTEPLITPLSPTSYATVAQPALSASGNLWAWSPQLRFQQRVSLTANGRGLSFEGGLIYPMTPSYYSSQLNSAISAGRRPGIEGRVAYHANSTSAETLRSFVFGVGAYTASQYYASNTHVQAWAVTGDWQIPLAKRVDFSGEIYRGNAFAGLGGGLYKDVLVGTDPISGASRTIGVDAAGGWTQLKLALSSRLEANAMFGLDDAFSRSYYTLVLPVSYNPLTLAARNSTITGNLVFRPRSSLILSPEYRHLESWRYSGTPNVANIFTLSAGYQF